MSKQIYFYNDEQSICDCCHCEYDSFNYIDLAIFIKYGLEIDNNGTVTDKLLSDIFHVKQKVINMFHNRQPPKIEFICMRAINFDWFSEIDKGTES